MLRHLQPDFSLYAMIDWHDVSSIFEERYTTLTRWSHMLETTVLEQTLAADMAVGFQEIRRIVPNLAQYQRLKETTAALTVYALPDADVHLDNLDYVALYPGDLLVREWFVLVRHPDYSRALVARERRDAPRTFHGILTSDPAQVEHFYEALMLAMQQKA